jgi:hypothetical protein
MNEIDYPTTIAAAMVLNGMTVAEIADATRLDEHEVEAILDGRRPLQGREFGAMLAALGRHLQHDA